MAVTTTACDMLPRCDDLRQGNWSPGPSHTDLGDGTYTEGYNGFSGCDITAWQEGLEVATMQGIAYSISREMAPIYTMGVSDPKEFARGKRSIAGSVVFIHLDKNVKLDPKKPFDVELRAYNEHGSIAAMKVIGVELLDGGYPPEGELELEHPYCYVAQDIIPWELVGSAAREPKDKHEGMIYNPYTGGWSWL